MQVLTHGSHNHISTRPPHLELPATMMDTHHTPPHHPQDPPLQSSHPTPTQPTTNRPYNHTHSPEYIPATPPPWPLHPHHLLATTPQMPNPIVFTLCMLAICLPILSVQLPRTALYTRLRSKTTETRSARFTQGALAGGNAAEGKAAARGGEEAGPGEESSQQQSEYTQHAQQNQDPYTAKNASGFLRRGHDAVSRGVAHQGRRETQGFDGADSGAPGAEEKEVSGRKPWDPPFPRRESGRVGSWRVLPPVGVRERGVDGVEEEGWKGNVDEEGKGKGRAEEKVMEKVGAGAGAKNGEEQDVKPLPPQRDGQEKEQRGLPDKVEKSRGMLIAWIGAAVMTSLLFLLGFAILIAHCLAWFLVYKTEARLGEARRGIMTSGDMRLCLCAA